MPSRPSGSPVSPALQVSSLPCCHCPTAASFPKMSPALLDVPVLAARFNINEEGLRYLRQWVNESGVRWGIDDDNVQGLSFPYRAHRQFGLTRMLLRVCMESSPGEWNEVLLL